MKIPTGWGMATRGIKKKTLASQKTSSLCFSNCLFNGILVYGLFVLYPRLYAFNLVILLYLVVFTIVGFVDTGSPMP